MIARLWKTVAVFFCASLGGFAIADETAGGWALANDVYADNGEITGQDYTLYTVAEDKLGAAFRCNNGKLFAVLSTRPVDLRYWMSLPPDEGKTRRVSFTVDGETEKPDVWISIYNGRMYMATRISSTNVMYKTALAGGKVHFNKRKSQGVDIELPPGDRQLFDHFLDACELQDRHHPFASDKGAAADEESSDS